MLVMNSLVIAFVITFCDLPARCLGNLITQSEMGNDTTLIEVVARHKTEHVVYHMKFEGKISDSINFLSTPDAAFDFLECGTGVLASDDTMLITSKLDEIEVVDCLKSIIRKHVSIDQISNSTMSVNSQREMSRSFWRTISEWFKKAWAWVKSIFKS